MAILTLLMLVSSCAETPRSSPYPAIAYYNAHASEYNSRSVVVDGYMVLGPEATYVVERVGYPDVYRGQNKGCLSLVNVGDLDDHQDLLNNKHVRITGTFVGNILPYGVSFRECSTTGMDLGGDWKSAIKIIE